MLFLPMLFFKILVLYWNIIQQKRDLFLKNLKVTIHQNKIVIKDPVKRIIR